jgi:hypothetical protein
MAAKRSPPPSIIVIGKMDSNVEAFNAAGSGKVAVGLIKWMIRIRGLDTAVPMLVE